jgi:nicotinamidase-related amidase
MKTALLVIDVQKIYTSKDSEMYCRDAHKTVDKINALIANSMERNEKIFYIRHVHDKNGSDLGRMFDYAGDFDGEFNFKSDSAEIDFDPALTLAKHAEHLSKQRYSAFANTNLLALLQKSGIQKVAICGFMTNFCCDSTARDAHALDFFVDFIVDATGTPGTDKFSQKEIRDIEAELLSSGFAVVKNTQNYLKSQAS